VLWAYAASECMHFRGQIGWWPPWRDPGAVREHRPVLIPQPVERDGDAAEERRRPTRLLSAVAPAASTSSAKAVSVFREVPDLLSALGPRARELADLRAPLVTVEPGPWLPPVPRGGAGRHFGLLLLDGLAMRRLSVNGRTGAELLGSGDLLQPWLLQPPYDTLRAESDWDVLERARLAVLDADFARQVAPWPEVGAALVARALERARRLSFHHVVSHFPGLSGRLLALFWSLADRWGRVTSDGVVVPVELTHAAVAELVGASRPSVSTALAHLAREGTVRRIAGGWLLDMNSMELIDPGPEGMTPAA
jgi:CRP/FNR family transcriptional regulator, cyclic AMP receptor protein